MEGLIQLVADSFARNGIECPAAALPMSESPIPSVVSLPTALPEHNYRKTQASLA
jgi:hypothetical protein